MSNKKTFLAAVMLTVNEIAFYALVTRRVSYHLIFLAVVCAWVSIVATYWSTGDISDLLLACAIVKAWGYARSYLKNFSETAFDAKLIC